MPKKKETPKLKRITIQVWRTSSRRESQTTLDNSILDSLKKTIILEKIRGIHTYHTPNLD